jgi:sulfite exporter TauE/SafE
MWLTAIIIGFAGSLHCLGMCSPLVMAVTSIRSSFFVNRLVYNGGRVFSYGVLGAMVSAFGSLFQFSGFQNILSIGLGSVLIIIGLAGVSHIRIPFVTAPLQRLTGVIKKMFSKFLERKTVISLAAMGMLNGLLPCGLTYLALTYCLTLADGLSGFYFMLLFGAGTLPVMLGFTSVIQFLMSQFKFSFRKMTTVMMIALGTLLITRSLYTHYHENVISTVSDNAVICKD